MKPRRHFSAARLSFPLATAIAALLAAPSLQAQTTRTWDTASGTAWLTNTNWSSDIAPGAVGSTASTDIAAFTNTAISGNALGINMNTSSYVYSLGAINWNMAAGAAAVIGNSSTTAGAAGTLRLNGASVNVGLTGGTISNLLVGIGDSATQNLTIQNIAGSGTRTMGVQLGSTSGTMYVTSGRTLTISSIISELAATSGFSKTGAGTLTLSGANTYTGLTTVSAGTLRATTSAQALGNGAATLSLGGGTLQLAHTAGLNFGRNTTVTATSTITADRTTASATSLSHTLGTLSIGAQTLNITRGSGITGSGTGGIIFGNTTMTAAPIFDTATNTNLTLGALGGEFALTKQGIGQLILATTSTRTTAAGITNLSAGRLRLETANALNTLATAPLNISGGTLSLAVTAGATYGGTATTVSGAATVEAGTADVVTDVTQTLGTLSIGAFELDITKGSQVNGTGGITFGTTTLTGAPTFDTATSTNLTLGAVSGGFGLTKQGAGTLTLSTASSYTGLTTVNVGELLVTHADALGDTTNGTTVTAAGAGLTVGNGITTNSGESITIAGGGTNFGGALRAGTGGGTWAGTVNLNGTAARTGAAAGTTLTITGSIVDGTGNALAVSGDSGTGVVVFNPTTTNSYTGATSIIRGIVRLGKNNALPTGTALDVDSADSNPDAATFDMAGFNQTVATLQDTAAININGIVTNVGGSGPSTSTLTVNQSVATNFAGTIENGAVDKLVALTKSGSGVLTLSGTNTHTGGTTISNGVLSIATTGALPGFGTDGSYSVANGATLAVYNAVTDLNIASMLGTTNFAAGSSLGFDTTTANRTYSVVLADTAQGALGLTKLGANTLTLDQANTFTGTTTINGGALLLSHANALGGNNPGVNGTSAITMATGSILRPSITGVTVFAPITATGTVTIGAPSVGSQAFTDGVLTLAGAITGSGNVTFNSTQNLNNLNNILLTAQSSYLGSTLINTSSSNAGINNAHQIVVRLGIDDALPTTTVLTIDGGTGAGSGRVAEFVMNGYDQTLAGLSNVTRNLRTQRVVNSDVSAASTLTINGSVDSTYGGTIGLNQAANSMSPGNFPGGTNGNNILLTKGGSGTFTLTGASTFSGRTLISGGILSLENTSALSQSPLDTLNSVTGNGTNGLRTTVTNLTMGGLTGNKNLVDVFTDATGGPANTTANGGYDGLTGLTLNPVLGATHSYSGDIGNGSGSMTLTKSGLGTQVLSGTSNSYTGVTTINQGTLRISSINDFGAGSSSIGSAASGDIVIGSGTTGVLDYVGSGNSSNRTITVGSSTATHAGGASILSNGGAALNFTASTFNTAQATATAARALTLGGGGIGAVDGTIQDNNTVGGGTVAVTKQDAGTWTLSGANTFTGQTSVSAGTLILNSAGTAIATDANTATTSDILINGGTLELAASEQIANSGSINMTSGAFNFGAATGKTETIDKLTNSGGTFSTGANTLDVLGATVTWSGGTNTISAGGTVKDKHWVITGGISTVAATGTLEVKTGAGGGFEMNGAGSPSLTLDGSMLLNQNVTVDSTLTSGTASIAGSGSIDLQAGTRTFTINNGSATTDMSVSTVVANGGLIKDGAGTLEFSGANTYAAGTTVSAGTLALANNNAAGTGGIALSGANAVLQIASGITLANATNDITVSNATASVVRAVAASAAYNTGTIGDLASDLGAIDTTAQILAGTNSAGSDATLTMKFSDTNLAGNDAIRRSDVFSVSGTTGTDAYVLQLTASGLASDSVLGYSDGSLWNLAVTGNTGAGSLAGYYASSWTSFFSTNGGIFNADMLGAHGYDSGGTSVWAVVNYGSVGGGGFAAVPEPTSALVGLLIGAGLLRRRRGKNVEC